MTLNGALLLANAVGDSQCEVDSSDRPVYMGFAEAGSATSAAAWRIIKFTYSGTNSTFATMKHASGSIDSNKIWDSRADYQY